MECDTYKHHFSNANNKDEYISTGNTERLCTVPLSDSLAGNANSNANTKTTYTYNKITNSLGWCTYKRSAKNTIINTTVDCNTFKEADCTAQKDACAWNYVVGFNENFNFKTNGNGVCVPTAKKIEYIKTRYPDTDEQDQKIKEKREYCQQLGDKGVCQQRYKWNPTIHMLETTKDDFDSNHECELTTVQFRDALANSIPTACRRDDTNNTCVRWAKLNSANDQPDKQSDSLTLKYRSEFPISPTGEHLIIGTVLSYAAQDDDCAKKDNMQLTQVACMSKPGIIPEAKDCLCKGIDMANLDNTTSNSANIVMRAQ